MRKLSSLVLIAGSGALLAACAGPDYENLHVTGSSFDKELYEGYRSLANAEWNEGDGSDGRTFGSRAVEAAKGNRPEPETISARELPADKMGELNDSRNKLVAALNKGAADKLPQDAARAQVMFDCWMQEQEENFQSEDIAECRSGFQTAMARIDGEMNRAAASEAAKVAPAAGPEPKPEKQTTDFVVYFDFNSAKLNRNAETALSVISSEIEPGARILIKGYADRAGASEYNDILASKRTAAVYSALKESGVNGEFITADYGEGRNAIKTKDGAREKLNRRVEVTVTQ